MIIGLVGEKLSGKDTVAKYLIEKYGADHIRYSDTLDEILNLLDLPISRRNEIDLGLSLRSGFGKGVLNGAVKKKVSMSSAKHTIINGIRFSDEMATAEQLGALIIYITAPIAVRYERYLQRHEKSDDGIQSMNEFEKQETEETERIIAALGAQANHRIDNDDSLEVLYHNIDQIMDKN